MKERILSHRDLIVYQKSFVAGKRIYEVSKSFPREEMYSLTDQVRRFSRSVSANIAEAWRKRRYEKHFCSTLNIAEAETAETQVWIEYAAAHGYLDQKTADQANALYDEIIRMIVAMIATPTKWCVGVNAQDEERRKQDCTKTRDQARRTRDNPDDYERGATVREKGADYSLPDSAPLIDQTDLLSLTLSLTPSLRVSVSPCPRVSVSANKHSPGGPSSVPGEQREESDA